MEEFNSEEQKNTEQNIKSLEQTTEHSSEFDARIPLENLKEAVSQLKSQIQQVIIGQDKFIDLLIVSLLADGHVLIEGVPGIAKTITSKLFAKTIDTSFNRIQFTRFDAE